MSTRANTIALKIPSFFPSFKFNLGQGAFSTSLCSDSALLLLLLLLFLGQNFFWCGFELGSSKLKKNCNF
jgi:hypothetical protein